MNVFRNLVWLLLLWLLRFLFAFSRAGWGIGGGCASGSFCLWKDATKTHRRDRTQKQKAAENASDAA